MIELKCRKQNISPREIVDVCQGHIVYFPHIKLIMNNVKSPQFSLRQLCPTEESHFIIGNTCSMNNKKENRS